MLAGDKESWRASLWNNLAPRVRKMIVWMAGLDGSKAEVPFKSLTALERGKIHCTTRRLMKDFHRSSCVAPRAAKCQTISTEV